MSEKPAREHGPEMFRLLIENAREYAVFTTDTSGRITGWNAGAERMLGYVEAEVLGESASIVFTPEDRAAGVPERELSQAAADGRCEDRRCHVRKDGSRFRANGVVEAIRGRDGQHLGFGKMLRDETERERLIAAEREAEAAVRAKDAMLAVVSHELRAPVGVIVGWSQMLVAGAPDQKRADMAIAAIARNASSLARVVEDLMDYVRVSTDALGIRPEPMAFGPAVARAVEDFRAAAADKHVELCFSGQCGENGESGESGGATISGDAERLGQVLTNLLSNALKFTPEGGRVDVRLSRDAGEARVEVRDTGAGITSDFLPHVFEAFRQAGDNTAHRRAGLGLGLAIVRRIVELHGGRIWAESEGEGRGATFTVALPLL